LHSSFEGERGVSTKDKKEGIFQEQKERYLPKPERKASSKNRKRGIFQEQKTKSKKQRTKNKEQRTKNKKILKPGGLRILCD
jgi:hypothetical protein